MIAGVVFGATGFASRAMACPKCRLGASALTGFGVGDMPHVGAVDADPQQPNQPAVEADGTQAPDASALPPAPRAHGPLHPFELSGGLNFTTAYYHRGYLQENQGVIAQPYLTLAVVAYEDEHWRVTPYVSWWNSLHDEHTFNDGDLDAWYESELMAGTVVSRGPASLDVKYTLFSYPNGALSQIQEIGAKFSYDLASLWRKPGEPADFVLLAWVAVDKEMSDQNEPPVPSAAAAAASSAAASASPVQSRPARERFQRFPKSARYTPAGGGGDVSVAHAPIFHQPVAPEGGSGAEEGFDTSTQGTYIELGVEPSFRTKLGKTELGLSFPVVLGLGAGDYYQEVGGDNDPLGYVQAGVLATVPLPMPGDAKWYLSVGVSYLHLFADSLEFANYGDEDEIIGTVGIGFSF